MKARLLLTGALLAIAVQAAPAWAVCTPYWTQKRVPLSVRRMAAGDFDGDGRAELAVSTQTSAGLVRVAADGTINPTYSATPISGFVRDLTVGDVNGDGKLDVVVSDIENNNLIVLPGNGNATLGAPIVSQVEVSPTKLALDDFDGDGKVDVVFISYGATEVGVWRGQGDGTFTKLTRTPIRLDATAIATGDLDNDGFRDVVVTYFDTAFVDVLFGNGDGTFDSPVTAATQSAEDVEIADLDNDGDADLALVDWDSSTFTTVLNTGARSFGAPTVFLLEQFRSSPANASDVVAADVNGDGALDLLVAGTNGIYLATFIGRGDGTFEPPSYTFTTLFPVILAAGQFTDDDRIDVAVVESNGTYASILGNNCGESTTHITVQQPIVSVGQPATLTVVSASGADPLYFTPDPTAPTGTVRIMEGASEIASTTLQNGNRTIQLPNLAAGDHTLHAIYAGDSRYSPSTSATVLQKVTTEASSTTLTTSTPDPVGYGTGVALSAQARAPNGDPVIGNFRVYTDGVADEHDIYGSPASFYKSMPLGTHTFRVEFLGTATVPPSESNTVSRTVVKASSTIEASALRGVTRYGTAALTFRVFTNSSTEPTGTVSVLEGNVVLGTASVISSFATVNLPTLAVGKHFVRGVYSGDSLHNGSEAALLEHTVVSNDPFVIDVSIFGSQLNVTLFPPPTWYSMQFQRFTGGTWQTVRTQYDPYSWSTTAQTGETYIYRALAYTSAGALIATSNVDTAVSATFTDEPLLPGTTVKAQHFTEIATAVNALRTAAGLSPLALTFGAGGLVRAADVSALRTGISEVRASHGMVNATFTDAFTPGATLIRALHIQELRNALR
jgi:hypothetical protein